MIQKKGIVFVVCLLLLLLLSACENGTTGATQGTQGGVVLNGGTPTVPASTATATIATPTVEPTMPSSTPTAAPTTAAADTLQQIDWSNFTYTFGCFTANPVAVHMHNGEAVENDVRYSVQKPVFGDLTGDGQVEAVIIYHCEGGGTSPYLVYVYSGTAQHPFVLANMPDSKGALTSVMSAQITYGLLQLSGYGYARADALCCPSLHVTTISKWDGTRFETVSTKSIPYIPTPTK